MRPGATSTLLSTPPHFSTKSSGGYTTPRWKSYALGVWMGQRASWSSGTHVHQLLCKGRGTPQTETILWLPGAKPGEERGVVSLPSSRLAGAAAVSSYRKKWRRLSSPCICESQKNKPSNFMFLEINFCGVHARYQRPSKAPSPRFANLGKQGLTGGFLGMGPILSYGRGGASPSNPFGPELSTRNPKSEGLCKHT